MEIGVCIPTTGSPGAVCLAAESHNPSFPSWLATPDGGNPHVRCVGREPGLRAMAWIEALV